MNVAWMEKSPVAWLARGEVKIDKEDIQTARLDHERGVR